MQHLIELEQRISWLLEELSKSREEINRLTQDNIKLNSDIAQLNESISSQHALQDVQSAQVREEIKGSLSSLIDRIDTIKSQGMKGGAHGE